MALPVTRWEQDSREWITELGANYKKMKLPILSGSSQETATVSKEGNTECEVWGTNKTSSPSYCSFDCMKQWLDYHIDNKDASVNGIIKKKSSMGIPLNSKLPITRWDGPNRTWIANKAA